MNLTHFKRISALVIFCVLVYFVVDNWNWWLDLQKLSLDGFVLLSLILVSLWLLGGVIHQAIYLPLGLPLEYKESTALAISNNLLNQLPFIQGGPIFKSIYLKRRYGFQLSQFVASLGYMHLIQLFIYSFGGLIGLGAIYILYSIFSWKVTLLISGLMAVTVMLYLLTIFPVGQKLRKILKIESLVGAAFTLSQDKVFLAKLSVAYSISMILQAAQLYVAYMSLGYHISFFYCLVTIPFTILVSLIGITPGGLGLTEVVIAFLSSTLGFGLQEGAVSALLMRLVSMFWLIPSGGLSLYFLSNQKP